MTQQSQQPNNPSEQKLPKLTRKQKIFVDEYVKTGNGTNSATKAYDIQGKDPENIANQIAIENLRKPTIAIAIELTQKSIKDAMLEQGITPTKIAQKISKLLDNDHPLAIDKGLKQTATYLGLGENNTATQTKTVTYNNFFFNPELRQKVDSVEQDIKKAMQKDAQDV